MYLSRTGKYWRWMYGYSSVFIVPLSNALSSALRDLNFLNMSRSSSSISCSSSFSMTRPKYLIWRSLSGGLIAGNTDLSSLLYYYCVVALSYGWGIKGAELEPWFGVSETYFNGLYSWVSLICRLNFFSAVDCLCSSWEARPFKEFYLLCLELVEAWVALESNSLRAISKLEGLELWTF